MGKPGPRSRVYKLYSAPQQDVFSNPQLAFGLDFNCKITNYLFPQKSLFYGS